MEITTTSTSNTDATIKPDNKTTDEYVSFATGKLHFRFIDLVKNCSIVLNLIFFSITL